MQCIVEFAILYSIKNYYTLLSIMRHAVWENVQHHTWMEITIQGSSFGHIVYGEISNTIRGHVSVQFLVIFETVGKRYSLYQSSVAPIYYYSASCFASMAIFVIL